MKLTAPSTNCAALVVRGVPLVSSRPTTAKTPHQKGKAMTPALTSMTSSTLKHSRESGRWEGLMSLSGHFGSWDLYHHSMSSYLISSHVFPLFCFYPCITPVILSMITHRLTRFDCVYLCPALCTDLCIVLVYKPCVHIV